MLLRKLIIYGSAFLFLIGCSSKTTPEKSTSASSSEFTDKNGSQFWKDTDTLTQKLYCSGRIFPLQYRVLDANNAALQKYLKRDGPTPGALSPDTLLILIPLPDGTWENYKISQVKVMAPELAAKYPDIKTYSGKSTLFPSDNIRLDLSSKGVRVMIQSTRGTMMIDPYCNNDEKHVISYFRKNLPDNPKEDFER